MKITFISLNDSLGGAAVVTLRLACALRSLGHEVYMIVGHKTLDEPWIVQAEPQWRLKACFLRERLGIFTANGFDRSDLFKVSTASCGMPLEKHPLVIGADAVVLGWFNQGLLSLDSLGRILASGKKTFWMMHDLWAMTGICHLPGACTRFHDDCGQCPFLHHRASENDLSRRIWRRKESLYSKTENPLRFIAVSSWVASMARQSGLLRDKKIDIIHNGLDLSRYGLHPKYSREALDLPRYGKIIVMGAARLDDPIKGLGFAIDALNRLSETPEGKEVTAVFFGNMRDPKALEHLNLPYVWLGHLPDPAAIESLYIHADVVMSSSLCETFGATLCEGMACGCVPVAFSAGGMTDIIEHEKNGYLARPQDPADLASALIHALSAPFSKETLRTSAMRFDISRIAARFAALISK